MLKNNTGEGKEFPNTNREGFMSNNPPKFSRQEIVTTSGAISERRRTGNIKPESISRMVMKGELEKINDLFKEMRKTSSDNIDILLRTLLEIPLEEWYIAGTIAEEIARILTEKEKARILNIYNQKKTFGQNPLIALIVARTG